MEQFKPDKEKALTAVKSLQELVSELIKISGNCKDELVKLHESCPTTTLAVVFITKGILLSILYSLALLKSTLDGDMLSSIEENDVFNKMKPDHDPTKWN